MSRGARVLVLNPNSSVAVTQSLFDGLTRLGLPDIEFTAERLPQAPTAIEKPGDHERVTPMVVDRIAAVAADYDAVIVACHGDPGVHAARAVTRTPVVGIGETSLRTAAAIAPFGVLTLGTRLVERKRQQVRDSGAWAQCVAVVATETGVEHGLQPEPDLAPYLSAAEKAIAAGAQVLVLGCAGMAPLAHQMAVRTGVPVIDPVAAAVHAVAAMANHTTQPTEIA